ncbi:hypothetical protein M8Z33_04520 [Streptomyces sp. ZAF1911]|nr:hypothetical protein [Streptomyces sp. ZAF1911]MDD9375944.1 hypothetical protein [Streptomyces sp. ZAF1911]
MGTESATSSRVSLLVVEYWTISAFSVIDTPGPGPVPGGWW